MGSNAPAAYNPFYNEKEKLGSFKSWSLSWISSIKSIFKTLEKYKHILNISRIGGILINTGFSIDTVMSVHGIYKICKYNPNLYIQFHMANSSSTPTYIITRTYFIVAILSVLFTQALP
jgi:hypothetical protein